MPSTKGSADLLEDRRKRALKLLDGRHSLNEVARRIGCFASSVMHWRCTATGWNKSVEGALLSRPSLEAECRATPALDRFAARRTTRVWLSDQSVDHDSHCRGDPSQVWNSLSPRSCRSVNAQPTMESPEARAARLGAEGSRDRALEEKGLAARKKNAARLGAHIVFADESGFLLIPTVVRTWAPRGKTPIHRHRQGRRDKISVISGISLSPKRHRLGLYYLLFFENIAHEEVCVFLLALLRHLRGPIIALLDNSTTHKGEPLEKLR